MFFRSATLASATAAVFLACASVAEAMPSVALGGHGLNTRSGHQHRALAARGSSDTVTPTAPGPGDSFKQGDTCTTEWSSTTNSSWKNFKIDFMTGANTAMVKLATIAEDMDGTDSSVTSFSWTCPEVSPYSAIYFYQFTTKDGSDPQWTTRFTITDSSGSSTDPTNSTTSDGETIEWGTGKLVSDVTTSKGGSSSSSSASSSGASDASTSSSASTASSTSSGSTSSTSNSTTDDDDSDDAASTTSSAAKSAATTSSSANKSTSTTSSSSSSTSNSSTSGASAMLVPGQMMAMLALVAGAAASLL